MIDVVVAYPNSDSLTFDDVYYADKHTPLVNHLLSQHGLLYLRVHRCANEQSPYYLMTHLGFDSLEAYEAAFAQAGNRLIEDIGNFTNIEPHIHVYNVIDQRDNSVH